ncbi:MAG: hypothetical protein HY270_21260 [Deltaproteobacteria bacterium]|nr:hypothetical protein [Deltaproteobacteria bacterium]
MLRLQIIRRESSFVLFGIGVLVVLLAGWCGRVDAACVGDCGGDGEVTVEEILTGVNIALGTLPLTSCSNFDANGDGEVTVDELIRAVNAALVGCPVEPTATPTVTSTAVPTASLAATPSSSPTYTSSPTSTSTTTATLATPSATATGPTPTPTATPEAFVRAFAGEAAVVGNGLGAFAPLVTGIITGLRSNSPTCPGGGQVEVSCSGSPFVIITIAFTGCTLVTPTGTLTFDTGTITLRGPGQCPNIVVAAPSIDETVSVTATQRDSEGRQTLAINASLNGSVTAITVNPGSPCFLTAGTVFLNGSITAQLPNGSGSEVRFDNTMTGFEIQKFNPGCVPVQYALTFNGSETVTELQSGASFVADLTDVVTAQDATVTPPQTRLSGSIMSNCFGGTFALQTTAPLISSSDDICYDAGSIDVTRDAVTQRISFTAGGQVGIDTNVDGAPDLTYASCLDPALFVCNEPGH